MLGNYSVVDESVTAGVDRRRARRFSLQLTCQVSSTGLDQKCGITRDMSRSGLSVVFSDDAPLPCARERVRIAVDLPHHPQVSPRFLVCMAETVRVADSETDSRMAGFRIDRWWIQQAPPQA